MFNNPQVKLKARPGFSEYFIIDLGKVKVSSTYTEEKNRIFAKPDELRTVVSYNIILEQLNILNHNNEIIAEPNDIGIYVKKLALSDNEKNLTLEDADMSIDVKVEIFNEFKLKLRQLDFKNLLKFSDLNITYTDGQTLMYYNYTQPVSQKEISDKSIKNINTELCSVTKDEDNKDVKDLINLITKITIPRLSLELAFIDEAFSNMIINNFNFNLEKRVSSEMEMQISINEVLMNSIIYINNDGSKTSKKLLFMKKLNHQTNLFGDSDTDKKDTDKGTEKVSEDNQLFIRYNQDIYKEKLINMSLSNLMVFTRLDTIMNLQNFFLKGMPTYSPNDIDLPNGYDPNQDNSPGMRLLLELKNPFICFPSDNDMEDKILALKSEIIIIYEKMKLKTLKDELKQTFKDTQSQREALKLNPNETKQEEIDIKQKEIQKIKDMLKKTIMHTSITIFNSQFLLTTIDAIYNKTFGLNRKIIENSLIQINLRTYLEIENDTVYVMTNETRVELEKTSVMITYKVRTTNLLII